MKSKDKPKCDECRGALRSTLEGDVSPALDAHLQLIQKRLPQAKVITEVCSKCKRVHVHVKV